MSRIWRRLVHKSSSDPALSGPVTIFLMSLKRFTISSISPRMGKKRSLSKPLTIAKGLLLNSFHFLPIIPRTPLPMSPQDAEVFASAGAAPVAGALWMGVAEALAGAGLALPKYLPTTPANLVSTPLNPSTPFCTRMSKYFWGLAIRSLRKRTTWPKRTIPLIRTLMPNEATRRTKEKTLSMASSIQDLTLLKSLFQPSFMVFHRLFSLLITVAAAFCKASGSFLKMKFPVMLEILFRVEVANPLMGSHRLLTC